MKMKRMLLATLCLATQTAAFATMPDTHLKELGDTSRVFDLDEVTVLSQPKEFFRLRQKATSATMMGREEMQMLGIADLRGFSTFSPNFSMPDYGSRYTSAMYVRGIGSRINAPALGIYIDNIPQLNKSAFNTHIYQAERIDVLRGPQGTLYGQNTEGGLVRLYSIDPFRYQGTDIKLSVGSHFTREAEVSTHQKVSDKVGVSLSLFYDGQDGFFRNQTTGERADRSNEMGGKLRIAWRPTERLQLDFTTDGQWVEQNGFPYGLLDLETQRAADPACNIQGTYKRVIWNTGFNVNYKGRGFQVNNAFSWQYLFDDMDMDIDYSPRDSMEMRQRQVGNALTEELTFKGLALGRWHWTLGAFFSHEWLRTTAPVMFHDGFNNQISQSIHDAIYYPMLNAMAGRMEKLMGQQAAQKWAQRIIDFAGGVGVNFQLGDIPGFFHTPQTNLGLFHESNIDITDRLKATLGLRYDLSHVSIDYETRAQVDVDMRVMGVKVHSSVLSELMHSESNTYNQLLPKLGLTYRVDKHGSNVYATVAKGYRAGGFNMQMFSDILRKEVDNQNIRSSRKSTHIVVAHDEKAYDNIRETISYKPEESWNYEFGTHLNLFDRKLQLDFSGFYMQIRNQQLSVMAGNYGFGRMMENAGKSNSCGVEVQLRGSLFEGRLNWSADYGYTRAVFNEYNDSVANAETGLNELVSYADKRVPYVPEHTFAARVDYRFDLGETLKSITLGANVSGQGKTYWDNDNLYCQKVYATLGAHALFDFGKVKVNLWGRNLTDTRFNTFAVETSGNYYAQRGRPFSCGLDLRLHL